MFARNLLGLLFAALIAGPAFAQFQQQPLARPTISPYTQLLNQNIPLYQRYYNNYLPQVQALQNANNLQQQVNGLQNAGLNAYPGTGNELSTGKLPGFFTHRAYFLNNANGGLPTGITGQIGTAGNNTIFQSPQNARSPLTNPQQSTIGSGSSIMPFNR